METRTKHTTVLMPDESLLEVSYYCTAKKMDENEKNNFTNLVIQLYDCTCRIKIDQAIAKDKNRLEKMVHNKVINAKGHLC